MRLDQAIAARFAEISRRKARELIAQKRVLVNERRVAVASREVADTDRIAIVDQSAPELPIVALAADWVALDKPAGMPTQPPRDRKVRSAEELLRIRFGEIYLVHRIDTPTSGIVLFARTRAAAARLSELFATGAMRKTYVALAAGSIGAEIVADEPIEGREAKTVIRPIRAVDGRTLVEAEILTGRTHQIRIHLAALSHPVVGDRRFGGPPAARLMLHAWKLEHPSVGSLIAPLPPELAPE
jgi:23S rRNA-/tRNA-specific pseudouridylate synthase